VDLSHLKSLLSELISLPKETEWLEFKQNNSDPQEIGEYISALSNSAALHGQTNGYLVWGIEDGTHSLIGTTFKPRLAKVGNQELENWLATQLTPRINFKINEFSIDNNDVVFLEIPSALNFPVSFKGTEYIRIGTCKQKLKSFPEKERELWSIFSREPFEKGIALENVTEDLVLECLDYPCYFDSTKQRLPDNRKGIIEKLESEKFILRKLGNRFDITNLGAILFAKDLDLFERLSRKAIRVILYQDKSRIKTKREKIWRQGYASCFEDIVGFINDQLPENEHIGQALRKTQRMYPEIAIRELVANAIIHQDFYITGTGSMVEIFSNRIEITNPGKPLIDTLRFIDYSPRSRNEALASFLRRINICEERGTGIDKAIFAVEVFQLPAPDFTVTGESTKVTLFAYQKLARMSKEDRIRACYQHACLLHVSTEIMTNSSIRKRFSIEQKNYSMASRIIADTIEAELIKPFDPDNTSKKHAKYVPYWA